MNLKKREAFTQYLDQRTAEVNKLTLKLAEDDRRDEADFEKIRSNIFQVIKTIFSASGRVSPYEAEQIRFFDHKLTDIEETWQKALAAAKDHNDEKRVLQEQTKLEVISEVREMIEQLWGG